MTLPPLTPEDRARNIAKSTASPLGPNAHYANLRDPAGIVSRLACQCPIGSEHDDEGRPETFVWPDGPPRSPLGDPVRPASAIDPPPASPSGPEGAEGAPEPYRRPIEELIEASSLGTPAAKAARASVSEEQATAVVARSKALATAPPTTPVGITRPPLVAEHVASARPGDVLVLRMPTALAATESHALRSLAHHRPDIKVVVVASDVEVSVASGMYRAMADLVEGSAPFMAGTNAHNAAIVALGRTL